MKLFNSPSLKAPYIEQYYVAQHSTVKEVGYNRANLHTNSYMSK